MGDLVRKLNCSASKKQNATLENMMHVPSARRNDPSKLPWGWGQDAPTSDITRPVLVTVKDGDMPYVTPTNESGTIELKNSFVIGQRLPEQFSQRMPSRPKAATEDSRCKITVGRQNPEKLTSFSSAVAPRNARYPTMQRSTRSPARSMSKDMHDFNSEREVSRQGRWKKGIQKSWKEEGDMPSLVTDEDEASSTIHGGGHSVMTGVDTVGTGYTTDVTDASDESDDSPEPRLGGYRSSPPRGYNSNSSRPYSSPTRGYRSSQPRQDRQGNLSRRNGPGLWEGVAEDIGIIAGMLLSDGNACFSSAAELTKETIVSCRNET
jgi:hypothetical protein